MSKNFSIRASACVLLKNANNDSESIIDKHKKYVIPIFQRPFSWTNEQINKLITDIFISYWGLEGGPDEDPLFLGTIQLSEKKPINGGVSTQEIIDGQQRLSTLLIFFKVLKVKFPESSALKEIKIDWLETKVNNGRQQFFFQEFLNKDLLLEENTLNPYLSGAKVIADLVEEYTNDEHNNLCNQNIDHFVNYCISKIYFVVIETFAGLSKMLQIFNSINTTGLELNTGDIFKIKMYEYLVDKKGYDDTAFNEISRLYEKIDTYNSELGHRTILIQEILSIYQYVLIATFDLPNVLYGYGADTFYERLFDGLFNIKQWEHFSNIKTLELKLTEIEKIIDSRYYWETLSYPTGEDACAINLLWRSRYGRYQILIFIFLFRFRNDENHLDNLFLFIRQLSKLYVLYSS
ncbi:MAG: DUF262 domain-containing protein, partial [Cyclobacteriaceae bacterium]|nr:DUF262 domain-containing protein [Cyclobacteriaceae bacterium]